MRPEADPWIPMLNTALIGISGLFLITGRYYIGRKQVAKHRWSMLIATLFAALFLIVYVARALLFETKLFAGEGIVRLIYLLVLGSHVILATVIVPLVLITLTRALRGNFRAHRAIARWTLPIWLYVVASGWAVYFMLYRLS